MQRSVITDRHMTISYLLGTLPDAERLRVEQAFFANDEAFDEMLAAEDDLFCDYACDALAPAERAAFEARFLATPEGRRKLAFATALMEALERQRTARAQRPAGWFARSRLTRGWSPFALAAAVLLLAATTGWFALNIARSRSVAAGDRTRQQAAASNDRSARADLERQKAPNAPLVVSVLLSPNLTRGGGDAGRITLAPDVDVLRMQLEAARLVPGSYRATLRTAEGDIVWSGPVSRLATADRIAVDVPARLLSTHDYEMALGGTPGAPAASYVVTVVRR